MGARVKSPSTARQVRESVMSPPATPQSSITYAISPAAACRRSISTIRKLHKSYKRLGKSLVGWECTTILGEPVSSEPIVLSNRQKMNWLTTIVLILLHIGAVSALFMFSWPVVAATAFL